MNLHRPTTRMMTILAAACAVLVAGPTGCTESLSIQSTPPGATVFIDNRDVGTTPLEYRTRSATPLYYRIEKAPYDPAVGTVGTRLVRARIIGMIFTAGLLRILTSPQEFDRDSLVVSLGPASAAVEPEKWIACYQPALTSVRVQGKTAGSVVRTGKEGDAFAFRDDPVEIVVTPDDRTVHLHLQNRISHSVKVLWEDAVFVDFDHLSNPIGRQEKGAAGESHRTSVIAPGTSIDESVFPTSRRFEATHTLQTTDQACAQQCQQSAYQCMAAFNCSGYRSRGPYVGEAWLLFAIADGIDAGLCERRCLDQTHACLGSCTRLTRHSEGWQQLPIVPSLVRKCSQSEADFMRTAETAEPDTYAVLLPIGVGADTREYMLNFKAELFHYGHQRGCPAQ